MEKQRIVIIGATSAMAEHCARLWVEAGAVDLTLVGRDPVRIERVAADLRVRSPQSDIRGSLVDFMDPGAIQGAVGTVVAQGAPDIVLIAHGALSEQAKCQCDLLLCKEMLEINGVSPVLFAEAFAGAMEKAGKGTLAVIGSVAGDRGRRSNYVYGAAKGLVTRYVQGLQHRLAGSAVKVVLIKPGPTATPMTEHLQTQGARLATVQSVASTIVKAIERGWPTVYAPGIWRFIMLVIKHLPEIIFRRLNI